MRRAPWLRSLPRHAREPGPPGSPGAGALAFRRPTAVSDKAFDRAGLGLSQRFLESPDANGRTLSGTSAASTSQTGIGPDGHDAQAARERSDKPRPREPLSLHRSAVTGRRPSVDYPLL